ncbi:carboxylesterase family protein [Streptomyces sp. RS10V-4]|uniref:carboxylesterase/lipase family protein n=1 Tax=Streptomyces rhizoryzae TaxID=2932493 RepID=UPI00200445CD|nr:carboxylesterase family protein [Streptomyces rhizoryzae]MCK7622251.1 carboxylesterase family protein [Streptomyces rhizoryzae]
MPGEPEVRTAAGVVRGFRRGGQAVFRGIPYAQPPVGRLRFAAPVPALPWDGVRPAVAFGPTAPQSGPTAPRTGEDTGPLAGDAWLTLNVCTPDPGAAKLPVLVWIHGGGYIAGASSDPSYDPAALAGAGLVVVSLNYRVGAEGFALIEGAPANRGILDQIAALHWVRRNIAAFGGDPDRVTVAGQSAGAGTIAALLAIEPARGLFHRAIAHSVPGNHCTRALAARVTAALADRLGAAPTAAGLARVSPQRLADEVTALGTALADRHADWGRLARLGVAVCPVIDGELLTGPPGPAPTGGRTGGIDLLAGHTRDEFRLFSVLSGRYGTGADGTGGWTAEEARTALDLFAPPPHGGDAYRAAHPGATPGELLETVYSDALFRMPSLRLAEANAAAGGTSYLFELCLAAPASGGVLGACHSLDVPLAFGTLDSPTGRQLFGDRPAPEVRAVSRELQRAWVRFAATGDPGWAAYRPDRQLTRVLDTASRTVRYPEQTSRAIWQGHAAAPYDLP